MGIDYPPDPLVRGILYFVTPALGIKVEWQFYAEQS